MNVRNMYYFIRLQNHQEAWYEHKLKDFFNHSDYTEAVIVHHTGRSNDNSHFHILVKTHLKIPAFRVRLRQEFKAGKGNRHMSVKECIVDKTGDLEIVDEHYSVLVSKFDVRWYYKVVLYMFHECDKVSFRVVLNTMGLDEEEYKRVALLSPHRKTSLSEEKSNKIKKPGTFTRQCVDEAIAEFMCQGLLKDGVKKYDVLQFVIKCFGGNKKVFDQFIINRIYNVVAYHLFGSDFIDDMIGKVLML